VILFFFLLFKSHRKISESVIYLQKKAMFKTYTTHFNLLPQLFSVVI